MGTDHRGRPVNKNHTPKPRSWGRAVGEGIASMTLEKKPGDVGYDRKPDADGLLPSHDIVEQIGRNMEDSGYKRIK